MIDDELELGSYFYRRELMALLMEPNNQKNLQKFDDFRFIYVLKIDDLDEREIIYRFFKTLEIKIIEYGDENHITEPLIDIWIEKYDSPFVDYTLRRPLLSNINREKESHSYKEFVKLIRKSKNLTKILNNIQSLIKIVIE